MIKVLDSATALPENYYDQRQLLAGLEQLWSAQHYNPSRLRQLHQALGITGRHLALPYEQYLQPADFSLRNQQYVQVALELGEKVLRQLDLSDIDFLVFTSVTGLAVPSLDARLMNRLGLPSHLRRVPLFGLGCLGGAAGLARLYDLVGQSRRGVLLSVELCSLTLQPQDLSVANLVASGLFGDGAAAVLVGPSSEKLPEIVATRSAFFPNSEHVMGWDIGTSGFSIVLSPEVPHYARHHLAPAIEDFLAEHNLKASDIDHWVAHPGGPKVIDALQEALQLPETALQVTRRSLQEIGNLSSASVLFILDEFLKSPKVEHGHALMLAMGPAFCGELVLLRW